MAKKKYYRVSRVIREWQIYVSEAHAYIFSGPHSVNGMSQPSVYLVKF